MDGRAEPGNPFELKRMEQLWMAVGFPGMFQNEIRNPARIQKDFVVQVNFFRLDFGS